MNAKLCHPTQLKNSDLENDCHAKKKWLTYIVYHISDFKMLLKLTILFLPFNVLSIPTSIPECKCPGISQCNPSKCIQHLSREQRKYSVQKLETGRTKVFLYVYCKLFTCVVAFVIDNKHI